MSYIIPKICMIEKTNTHLWYSLNTGVCQLAAPYQITKKSKFKHHNFHNITVKCPYILHMRIPHVFTDSCLIAWEYTLTKDCGVGTGTSLEVQIIDAILYL